MLGNPMIRKLTDVIIENIITTSVSEYGIEGTEDEIKKTYKNNPDVESQLLLFLYKKYWLFKIK